MHQAAQVIFSAGHAAITAFAVPSISASDVAKAIQTFFCILSPRRMLRTSSRITIG